MANVRDGPAMAQGAEMRCQMDERAHRALLGCRQPLGRGKACASDSHWHATLRRG